MPEQICAECGKRMYHENETTLKVEDAIHKKFCRKEQGKSYSYMHRDAQNTAALDSERENDAGGKPVLK